MGGPTFSSDSKFVTMGDVNDLKGGPNGHSHTHFVKHACGGGGRTIKPRMKQIQELKLLTGDAIKGCCIKEGFRAKTDFALYLFCYKLFLVI